MTREILAVHFIQYPDRPRFARVFAALAQHPLPASDSGYSASMALLAAAAVNQDPALFDEAADAVQKLAGHRFRTRARIESFFFTPHRNARIETILPALQPLSPELNYALLARYARPAGAGGPPASETGANQPAPKK